MLSSKLIETSVFANAISLMRCCRVLHSFFGLLLFIILVYKMCGLFVISETRTFVELFCKPMELMERKTLPTSKYI